MNEPVPASAFVVNTLCRADASWLVSVEGELDTATAPTLGVTLDELAAKGPNVVALELSRVSFMDSSGLRVIVRATNALAERGGELSVEGVSATVRRTLEITGLLEHLRGDRVAPID